MTDIQKVMWVCKAMGLIVEDFGSIVWIAGREYTVDVETGEITGVKEDGE